MKMLPALSAVILMTAATNPAQAINFAASYTIDAAQSDPGLVIETKPIGMHTPSISIASASGRGSTSLRSGRRKPRSIRTIRFSADYRFVRFHLAGGLARPRRSWHHDRRDL